MQSAPLTVLSAGPNGEVQQRSDANEIRVIFSEPMVSLGRLPSNPAPPLDPHHPALSGTFRWSGTTILIFTPDRRRRCPTRRATRSRSMRRPRAKPDARGHAIPVLVHHADGEAASDAVVSPRAIRSTRWCSRCKFNQRVRPGRRRRASALTFKPHDFGPRRGLRRDRARLMAIGGCAIHGDSTRRSRPRARRASSERDAARTLADNWNREQFPPARLAVLETARRRRPGTWIQVTLDAQTTRRRRPARRQRRPQRSTAELDPCSSPTNSSARPRSIRRHNPM